MAGLGNSPFSVLPSAEEIRKINEDDGGAMSSVLAHAGVDVPVGTQLLVALGFGADDHFHIMGDVSKQDLEEIFPTLKAEGGGPIKAG